MPLLRVKIFIKSKFYTKSTNIFKAPIPDQNNTKN